MSLEDGDLRVVIDAMDECIVQPNEFVIKEGDPGDVLYIVETGDLNCTKVIDG
jgi:cAMP-dependent protein kinase regulator